MTWAEWIGAYDEVKAERGEDSPFLLHFRIGTSGKRDGDNTHPHVVDRDLVMAHNGILSGWSIKDDARSDTRIFIDEMLRGLPEGWLDSTAHDLVEGYIGRGNKLVFLAGIDCPVEYGVYILNEHLGEWDKDQDIWYSNDSYRRAKYNFGWARKVSAGALLPSAWSTWDDDWPTGELVVKDNGEVVEMTSLASDDGPDDGRICFLCASTIPDGDGPWCWDCESCTVCEEDFDDCICGYGDYVEWHLWRDSVRPDDTPRRKLVTGSSLLALTDDEWERLEQAMEDGGR